MNKSIFWIFASAFAISCAGIAKNDLQKQLPSVDDRFIYTDKNGEFQIKSSTAYDKKTKTFS